MAWSGYAGQSAAQWQQAQPRPATGQWQEQQARPTQAGPGKGGPPQQQQQQQQQQLQQQQQQMGKGKPAGAGGDKGAKGEEGEKGGAAPYRLVPGGKMGGGPPPAETYVVTTKGNDGNEVVVRTLIGEYVEHGSNHGRKVYKKVTDVTDSNGEHVDVFLYYWDKRDGPTLEGWWFGNQLGGSQVWSHCQAGTLTPPGTGWQIPWDGQVRPTLVVAPKGGASMEPMDKLKEAGSKTTEVNMNAKAAYEKAKALAGDYANPEGLNAAEEVLVQQMPAITDLVRKLTELQREASGDGARQLAQMGNSIRGAHQALSAEITKIRQSKAKVEESEQQRAAEEKEAGALQDVMQEAGQKTNIAEDAVEKAQITSEMITAGGDDMDEVRQAVNATEQAAQEAQKAIGEARIYLNAKQASARRFESDRIKQQAAAELSKLQQQLQEAQNRLNPLKNVRQDFVQRTAAQKLMQEVFEKLSPAEVDVDRAEEATVMLSGDGLTKETMDLAEQAVANANEHIATVVKFLEQKKKTAAGLPLAEIGKMEERVQASQQRLQDLKGVQKEARERVTCETLLKEAAEKLLAVAEAVSKAADAEGPFLMGVEELPLEETLTAVKACETAATAANTTASIARMFISTKLVESKRFSAGPSKETQAQLKDFQRELESHTKKLTDLKRSTAMRKKAATMREAEYEVQKAEELAKQVGEAASPFEDDSKLLALTSKEIRAASDETVKAEQAANAALQEARQFITARQIESKGKEMSAEVSAELIKYQTRLSTAQAEVGKYKKLASTVEQRLAAKKVLDDAQSKLRAAEEKVSKVAAMVEALGSEQPASTEEPAEGSEAAASKDGESAEPALIKDPAKQAEHAAAEAQVSLKTVARFLETQTRVQGATKGEIAKLQPLVKEAQERLDATVATMRERAEKILVDGLIKESDGRVKESEECIKKVAEAEAVFAQSTDELPIDEASNALNELESALAAAHSAVGGAKTFLAMKRLAAKRLSERSEKATLEQLTELQARLDAVTKALAEAKKGMAERKLATVKREVAEKVIEVEKKVEAATSATKVLYQGGAEVKPEEMKANCETAGSAQQEAQTALASTRALLMTRQRDAKVIATDSSMLTEISRMLERLTRLQAELDKQKAMLREQEHKFVAQRLLKDAAELVEELEKKLETTVEAASPLASDKEDFAAGVFLSQAVEALRAHMKGASKTSKDLFRAMSQNGSVTQSKFVDYCSGLPELKEESGNVLSDEQLQAAFSRLDVKGGGQITEEDFVHQFRVRMICATPISMTDQLAVKGGKTVRKMELNEIVEALSEPTRDESVGLMRLKCRAEKDGKEGFISVAGNQGTVYLEPYSLHAALRRRIEKILQECADAAKEAAKHLELKIEELKSVRVGPLADTKAELGRLRPRVSKVQYTQSQLKKKVSESEKRMKEQVELERRKRQEAAERKAAAGMIKEVEALMNASTAAVDAAMPAVEKLVKSRGAELDNPLKAMEQGEKELEAASASVEKALAKVKEHLEAIKTSSKGPFSEAKSMLVKTKVMVGALESRCKKQIVALKSARKQVAGDAEQAVMNALRAHCQKEAIKTDELFQRLSEGKPDISAAKLREFVEKIPKISLKAVQLDIGFDAYSAGVTRLAFSEMLQEYQRCVKDIAFTTSFQIKDGKALRKLRVGEIVEVLESAKVDDATRVPRVKCRALKDETEGWVTLRSNQGMEFLEKSAKPYFCCEDEVTMQAALKTGSAEVCKAQVGEVMEVLAGPQKEPPVETQRVRGKAKDGKTGWVTLKDSQGNVNLESTKLLVCKESISITTTFDITEGKALRRLDVGETLEIVEGPKEDSVRTLTRVKAKAKNDGKEGWVTMKGNRGTAYIEETTRHHICLRSVTLESSLSTGSKRLRTLEEGDVLEVLDGPKADQKEGPNRVKGRNLSSGGEGWFTLGAKSVQPWSPQYQCAQATTLTDGLEIKGAKAVRKLEAGETLVALEAPVLERAAGLMRARVRAEKDGAIGFATVRGNQGTLLLKPVLAVLG